MDLLIDREIKVSICLDVNLVMFQTMGIVSHYSSVGYLSLFYRYGSQNVTNMSVA